MREQSGHIFKASGAWYLKYRTDVIEDGKVNRVLKTHRLADLDDRCRTISDAKKMAKEFLKPFNEGKISAQSSVSLTPLCREHMATLDQESSESRERG